MALAFFNANAITYLKFNDIATLKENKFIGTYNFKQF